MARDPGNQNSQDADGGRLPWHAAPASEVLERLVSTERGLSEDEAAHRLDLVGANRLSARELEPGGEIVARQLQSIATVVLVSAVVSALFLGRSLEALVIGVVALSNVAIGVGVELRSRRFLEFVLRNRRFAAVVLRDGQRMQVEASRLVPGDVIELGPGQRVPADARLILSSGVRVDQEVVSGDGKPVAKAADPPAAVSTPVARRTSMLFSGSTVLEGHARAVVTATGASSAAVRLRRIGKVLGRRAVSLETRVERFGRRIAWVTAGLAGIGLVGARVRGLLFEPLVETWMTLAVASVPHALPAVVLIGLAVSVRRMARGRTSVRHTGAIEALGAGTVVCTDLAETLTSGVPRASLVVTPSSRATVVQGPGGRRRRLEIEPSTPGARADVEGLLRAAALTLDAPPTDTASLRDPAAQALWELVSGLGMDPRDLLRQVPAFAVIPYDGSNRMGASFRHEGTGSSAFIRGAPDAVLSRCATAIGPLGTRAIDPATRARIEADAKALAAHGYRVIAFAQHLTAARSEDLLEPFVYLGMVGLEETPAPGVADTVALLDQAGIRTVLLTDEEGVAGQALARKAGVRIRDDAVVDLPGGPGPLPPARKSASGVVFGRLGTDGRRRIVDGLRERGEVVLAVETEGQASPGNADVTVMVGEEVGEVEGSTADVVLGGGGFASVVQAIRDGRLAHDNVRRSISYLFACTLAELLLLVGASAMGLPLPLSPLQILWLNLVIVALPAVALAAEPAAPDLMARPSRGTRGGILTRHEIVSFSGFGLLMALAALAAFLVALDVRSGGHAATAVFTTMALAQLFHLDHARSRGSRAFGGNPWLIRGVFAAVSLQILSVYWGPLANILDTTPLGPSEWALALGFALAPAVLGRVTRLPGKDFNLDVWRRRLPRAPSAAPEPEEPLFQSAILYEGGASPRPRRKLLPARVDDPWPSARAAVETGDVGRLQELLEAHPRLVEARDSEGTLLHHATGMPTLSSAPRAPEMVSVLVEAGADPDAGERRDGSGETPLIQAVSLNNVPVAQRLLELGADPERHGRYPEQGIDTALGYALLYGKDPWFGLERGDCVELLLDWGALTPLPLRAALGRRAAVEEMLPAATKEDRQRAMVFAAHRGEAAVVQSCLDAGVDPTALTSFFHERLTPLLAAAGQGHQATVQVLLDAGVEAELPEDGLGTKAMLWAWTRW